MSNIVLKNISHAYAKEKVLDQVNFSIEEGELLTLLGPSGCGKTTILRIIAGFIIPDEGTVANGEKDITAWTPESRNMGIVFQNYALFPNMSVRDNIAYGLKIRIKDKTSIRDKCEQYMELTGLLQYQNRKVNELSGGQQQRVAIARALAIEPQMLLLDEPMSNLDVSLRTKMREEIRAIQKKTGITTLFITHDQQEALSISDRVAVMQKGRILKMGTPKEIYDDPGQDFVADFVGTSNHIGGAVLESLLGRRIADSVSVCVRPEQIQLSRDKGNGILVTVKEVKFMGMYFEYTVVGAQKEEYRIVEINLGKMYHEWHVNDRAYMTVDNIGDMVGGYE